MRNTQETATGWVCSDCMMLLCNGETPPDMSEEETATWLDSLDDTEITPGLMLDEHEDDCPNYLAGDHVTECGCEWREFSWSSCDSCHSKLGGARHAVTFWF